MNATTTHDADRNNLVTATLVCGHMFTTNVERLFANHTFPCFACDNNPREWVTFQSCDTGYNLRCKDCSYARTFGQAFTTARVKASSHAVRKAHAVEVRLDTSILYLSVTDTPSMFQDKSIPPF